MGSRVLCGGTSHGFAIAVILPSIHGTNLSDRYDTVLPILSAFRVSYTGPVKLMAGVLRTVSSPRLLVLPVWVLLGSHRLERAETLSGRGPWTL